MLEQRLNSSPALRAGGTDQPASEEEMSDIVERLDRVAKTVYRLAYDLGVASRDGVSEDGK